MPLRHLAYPGDVCWTEEGFRFAWHVMVMEKGGSVELHVRDVRAAFERGLTFVEAMAEPGLELWPRSTERMRMAPASAAGDSLAGFTMEPEESMYRSRSRLTVAEGGPTSAAILRHAISFWRPAQLRTR